MRYKNIKEFIKLYPTDLVVFCYGNYSTKDMIKNLMQSAKNIGVPVVLFALDESISTEMQGKCDVVDYFNSNIEADKFYIYGEFTPLYKEVVMQGWKIGQELLAAGKTIIYMDVDIVIKKDFRNYLLSLLTNDVDCVVQYNGPRVFKILACAGFYVLRPTERVLKMFPPMFFEDKQYLEHKSDQTYFNDVILKEKKINIQFLPQKVYPTGKYFFKHFIEIENECHIIHFNYIASDKKKIEAMKQYNNWLI